MGARDDRLCLEVQNKGTPIKEELLPKIFEPFVQEKSAGSGGNTGLGLFIVKTIVEAHGGQVSVSSTAVEGTTFKVLLPKAGPQPRAASEP